MSGVSIGTRAAWLAIALCTGSGCAAAPEGCEQAVTPALQQVLDWPREAWSFAIVEHRPSERFIQYAYGDGLYIDIPADALSADERRAAETLFGPSTWVTATNLENETVSATEAFQRDFASDAGAAARFGCRVLHEVLAVETDAELTVSFHGDPPPDPGAEPPLEATLRALGDAAARGDADAQYALATLLARRATDERTRAASETWMRKAAAQGHPEAAAALREAGSPPPDPSR